MQAWDCACMRFADHSLATWPFRPPRARVRRQTVLLSGCRMLSLAPALHAHAPLPIAVAYLLMLPPPRTPTRSPGMLYC